MRRLSLLPAFVLALLPALAWASSNLPSNVITGSAFIVNYDENGGFAGWGSGFFVAEGIVVTNRHVLENRNRHRVYAVGEDEKVNLKCYAEFWQGEVMFNPDGDVAYIYADPPCDHGILSFADDPVYGDPLLVLGFPYRSRETIQMVVTSGSMLGRTADGWFITDAHMDEGSSGGPVLNGTDVLGVAVAKGIDDVGDFVEAYFIPSSVIENGLINTNDSRFAYTPRSRASSSRSSSTSLSSSSSSRSSVRSSSSRRSSAAPLVFRDVSRSRSGYEAILSLYERGVISGYTDGTYRPDNGINRAEFIKILIVGFRPEELDDETDCFVDVHDEWFAPYVCAAKRLGWIDGYPDGTFRPAEEINRAEGIKIVTGAFGGSDRRATDLPSDVRAGMWFRPYVAMGVDIGIVDPDERFHAGLDLTREDAAIWIYGAGR